MTFFNKKVDVSEGGKYDATKVSDSGLSQEELAALKKKQLKALDIFNTDGKAGLSKEELTAALSMYSKYAGEDGVLTKKELKEMAKEMGDDVSWRDLKKALKSMVGLMQNKNDLVPVNNAENPTAATPENTGAAEDNAPKLNFDELSMDFNVELDKFVLDGLASSSSNAPSRVLSDVTVTANVDNNRQSRIKSRISTDPNNGEQTRFDYTYDSQGRKSLVSISDGSTIAYDYVGDSDNISDIIHKDANGNLIKSQHLEYNIAGQKVKDVRKDANGVITDTYDYYYADNGSSSKVQRNGSGSIVQVEKTEMLPDGSKQVTVLSNSANYLFAAVETYDKDGKMQNVRDLPVNTGNMNELIASLKINVPDNQG